MHKLISKRIIRIFALIVGTPVLLFLICCLIALLLSAFKPASKDALQKTMLTNDPSRVTLQSGFNSYVQLSRLPDGTEMGIITLKDGSSSKYWFLSHHKSGDTGGTWFEMSDGTRAFMAGAFCCEVQLPEDQIASLAELKKFISENDESPK